MSITYVYPGDRPWDCASQMGPCEDCRPIIDSSVNPRHLPVIRQKFEWLKGRSTGAIALVHVYYGRFNA